MNFIASALVTVLAGALAWLCASSIASACSNWYSVSTFEGAAAYYVLGIAFYGGVVGCIIGFVTTRFIHPTFGLGFFRALTTSAAIELGIAGIATVLCWSMADIPPRIDGRRLWLQVELRLPAGMTNLPAAEDKASRFTLGSVVRHVQRKSRDGKLKFAEARLEDGRWVIPGEVLLFTMRGHRSIDFAMGDRSFGGFLIPLPARPGKKFQQWSDWFPNPPPGRPPWPDTEPSCRFRLQQILPPPPPPDPAVVDARNFAALKPEAPLSEYLSFLNRYAPTERYQAVDKVIEQRPTELVQLIRSKDSNLREPALAAVARLSQVTPEISDAVLAEQRQLAAELKRFNDMKADDPKFYEVQIQQRTRFYYWNRAWWTVHQLTGVDGRPPVQELLDLANIRAKDSTMDEIVANAQAHLDGIKSSPPKTK